MKLFGLLRKNLKLLSIYAPVEFDKSKRINLHNVLIIIGGVLFTVMSVIYLIYEPNSITEYSESAYGTSTTFCITWSCILLVYNTTKIFNLIERFESLIQPRKFILTHIFIWSICYTNIKYVELYSGAHLRVNILLLDVANQLRFVIIVRW